MTINLKKTGLGFALALSILSPTNLPAIAQTNSTSVSITRTENRSTNLPANMTIVATFPKDVIFEVGQRQAQPITLFLAQPIVDNSGKAIVPANSPIKARLVPVSDGIKIQTQYVAVGGKRLPLKLSSDFIPGQTAREIQALAKAGRLGGFSRDFAILISNTIGLDPYTSDRVTSGLSAFGTIIGVLSPEQRKIVAIPRGEVVVLD